jgi:PAS domain S-box-containing protein
MTKMELEKLTEAGLIEELAALRKEVAKLKSLSARTEQEKDDLRPFFDQSLDLLCIAGFDGYFKRLSQTWSARFGYTLEELKARPFLDFVHPEDREATRAEMDKLAKGGKTLFFENRYRIQDGSYRWLRWNSQSVPVDQRIYAIAWDVTQQKRQEREILEIADREKARLGMELHDGLCQSLAGIAALSSTLSRRLAAHSESAASAAAAEITKLLNETIHQARGLAHGLDPIGLNNVGLDVVLETLALNIQRQFNITCTLEYNRSFPRLHLEIERHLFRIAQEAVNNAIAHGRANRIELSLSAKNGEGVLNIRDDGEGMREDARNSGGIGLHTMFYRARLISGNLKMRQRSLRGMAVTCTFPLTGIPKTHENLNHVRNDT